MTDRTRFVRISETDYQALVAYLGTTEAVLNRIVVGAWPDDELWAVYRDDHARARHVANKARIFRALDKQSTES